MDLSKNRVVYLDVLRIFSVFWMMVLHVAASKWSTVDVASTEWQAFNLYDSLARFCVPVFIMISGSLFLDNSRSFSMKKLLKKNVLRLACAFIFWSAVYSAVSNTLASSAKEITAKDYFISFICGHYHMWFVYAIIGLYLIVPFLRRITADKKLTEYFLILWVIVTGIFGLLKQFPFFDEFLPTVSSRLQINFVFGYTGYFVLGYYLKAYEIPSVLRKILYLLGIAGIAFTVIGTDLMSAESGTAYKGFYNNFMLNVILHSAAVFVFFKYNVSKIKWGEKSVRVITKLSALGFGMYLVHDLVNIFFAQKGFTTLLYNAYLSVPCNSLIVFAISLAAAFIISKIPVANKYLI